ncbi:HPP family protein [Sphingomonas aerolata]|uniref:HPP family protein n=1 Tax=Sphingomonas aerolata TaxID=185951 RepID=UPI00141AA59C|nr:HPP family protein [Sphingomonas aerolata]NII57277.1 CBS domain-containing membrane protein [Sphingomonas aerolata]
MPLPHAKAFWATAFPADRLLGGVGACIGIALTMLVCVALLPVGDVPQIVAPLGASAVLVFAVRSSPLAQPWPVIGGNTLSAAIGVAAFQLIPDASLAAGVAVGAAILAMSLLRCLHPPGGAAALTAVIGGPGIHAAGYAFALVPVALNSVVLVLVAGLFYRATRRPYPHHSALPPAAIAADRRAAGFHPDDIDAALEDMHESFDIARDDLHALLARAELHAQRRQHG